MSWASGAVLVSAVVGIIAFLQWRTAHQKVMLDLFDRRFSVFMDVRLIASNGADRNKFGQGLPNEIIARGRFLFGKEVVAILTEIHDLCTAKDIGQLKPGALDDAFRRFIESIEPYMKMDQKRVRTPAEWLSDRNKKRLSFSDIAHN
jgi:hypothetical protein